MYYKILLHCATHKTQSVRSTAQRRVSKMVSSLGGSQMALAFIREFRRLLATLKVTVVCRYLFNSFSHDSSFQCINS